MKNKIIILTFLIFINFLFAINLNSQGFDWQFDNRFPSKNPNLFVGVNSGFGLISNSGTIPYNEGAFSCCEFNSGSGTDFRFGISSEYWYDGLTAINANLLISASKSNFSNQQKIPRREYFLITNYELEAKSSFLILEFSGKRRLAGTNIFAGAGLGINVFLSKSLIFNEIKDSQTPINDPFTSRYNIPFANISDFYPFNLNANLFLGYDLSIANGYYLSPAVKVNLPIMSQIYDSNWARWEMQIFITLFRKL